MLSKINKEAEEDGALKLQAQTDASQNLISSVLSTIKTWTNSKVKTRQLWFDFSIPQR